MARVCGYLCAQICIFNFKESCFSSLPHNISLYTWFLQGLNLFFLFKIVATHLQRYSPHIRLQHMLHSLFVYLCLSLLSVTYESSFLPLVSEKNNNKSIFQDCISKDLDDE